MTAAMRWGVITKALNRELRIEFYRETLDVGFGDLNCLAFAARTQHDIVKPLHC